MPIQAGEVVDGFRVEAQLHEGGMATLWHVSAVDGSSPPEGYVMKLPRQRRGDDPASVVGFEVEQMIMPVLTGAHVPRFVAKGDFTRVPYIVMERIVGPTLKSRFDLAPLAIDDVVEIGWKVATALHELHRQHLVHLDVKPSNIMFRASGEAVLIDFGLSRHARLPDLLEEEFTLPMGTGPYMSPEQVRHVRHDPRSDLFGLGVLLYHLATGARPFGAPTSVRGLRERLWRAPLPPRAIRRDVPPWLQELILRCLEVDPGRRHATAAQLAFALRHPDQVPLTERAGRMDRGPRLAALRRRLAMLGEPKAAPPAAFSAGARGEIVLAALDVAGADAALLDAVRDVVAQLMSTTPGARLACLTVMREGAMPLPEPIGEDAASRHVELLVRLKHWAHPVTKALGLHGPGHDGRVTFHVIEAGDPAAAIVDYATRNQVDHIVIGARSSGKLRRHLGSVSAQVAAEAACTVSVVRTSAG
jgi:nucleotide-binding universal stress UspA family protein